MSIQEQQACVQAFKRGRPGVPEPHVPAGGRPGSIQCVCGREFTFAQGADMFFEHVHSCPEVPGD